MNNKLNGIVKKYYCNGKFQFQGEYSNDEANGNVKVFLILGKLFLMVNIQLIKKWLWETI